MGATVRQVLDAVAILDRLRPGRVEEITGPGGISGATAEQLLQVVSEARALAGLS
jgi:hypothetical protein